MSFPAYSEVADSGVEWFHVVPAHWEIKALRHLVTEIFNGLTATQVDSSDNTVPVTRIESISGGSIDYGRLGYIMNTDAREDRRLRKGDIQFSNINSLNMIGNCAMYEGDVLLYAGMNLLTLRPSRCIQSNWFFWLLRSNSLRKMVEALAKPAINQASISQSALMAIRVPLPSIGEQSAIASFLDRETSKIDNLIEQQKRLIDLLKEKRQAVISHAVTKGLNPDAPMKDSGIEWLGMVPAHWQVQRLRFLCDITTGGRDTVDAVPDGTYPFFVRSQEVERIDTWSMDCEAVLTAGDGVGVGKVFHHYTGKFDFHQRVYLFHNFKGIAGRFFYHYLQANFFKVALEGGAKSTVDSLRRPLIANFWISVPPKTEQLEIAQYVDGLSTSFEALIAEAESGISLLQERRSALISAAVTGKIDVRGLVKTEEQTEVEAA